MNDDALDIIYIPLGSAGMGGAERSIAYLAAGMARKGKRVEILAERALQTTAYPKLLEGWGLSVTWIDWAPEKSLLRNVIEASRTFGRYPARIIHFNISWRRGMWVIPVVARLVTNARLIGTMRAMPDPHQNIPRRKYLGLIPGIRLWHVPEVLAGWVWGRILDSTVSVNAIDYPARLVSGYGYPQSRIRAIYNGVKIRLTPIDSERRREVRRKLGAGSDDVIVNYFGRLADHKGIEYLIRSMSQLPHRYRLLLMGDGPEEENLRAVVAELALGERVRFLGFVSDVDDIVAASDVVVVPSIWYEACPRQIIEAMNQGVPVVASNLGGIPELFRDGVEGFLVPPSDTSALEDAIRRIGDNPGLRKRMGDAGRTYCKLHYDMDSIVDSYDRIYLELAPGV
ncbi:MAG: glycosyltransferase family 4 protein [Gemmatimonadota bacterium]|nr:glycosyltransferase family 4 protein [Gemmatimonadota bacterium]